MAIDQRVHNERIKLIATAFNNTGVASIVAGIVAPGFAGVPFSTQVVLAVGGIAIGGVAFIGAFRILGGLVDEG